MTRVNKWFILPTCIGVVVLIVGIVLVTVIFPNVIEKQVVSNVELKEGTLQWYRFKEIPFPFMFSVNLFTVTNKDEVLAGATPNVKEVGPFVYMEHREKNVHKVVQDEIEYSDVLTYVFNETQSAPNSEEDTITFLNAPVLAVLQSIESLPFDLGINIEDVLAEIFQDTNIFMEAKVKDLTFGGIKMCDPARNPGAIAKLVCLVIMLMNQKLLEYHEDLSMSFSLFKYKTKEDGPFTLKNGLTNIEDLGLITSYKGEEYTQFWEGEKSQCDRVNGFFTTFPPFMEEGSSYSVYSTDICKSIKIQQTSTDSFRSIPGSRFETVEKSFASDEDDCVCIHMTKGLNGEDRCYRNATLDLSTCMGVPVILSFPHLQWADKDLQTSISGLTPNDERNTEILFEPNLGYPLAGNIRLQFNMILRPTTFGNKVVGLTEKLPRAVLPLLWLDDNFQLTDELLDEVQTKLIDMLSLAEIVQWVLVGVGAGITVISIALLICCRRK